MRVLIVLAVVSTGGRGSPLQAIRDVREEPESGECQGDTADVRDGLLFARPVFHSKIGEPPHGNPPDHDQKGKKQFHPGVEGGNLLGKRGRVAYAASADSRQSGVHNRAFMDVDPFVAVGIPEEGCEFLWGSTVPARPIPERLRRCGKKWCRRAKGRAHELLKELDRRMGGIPCSTNQENICGDNEMYLKINGESVVGHRTVGGDLGRSGGHFLGGRGWPPHELYFCVMHRGRTT